MRFVFFVEGETEEYVLADWLGRWLNPQLSQPVKIEVINLQGNRKFLKEIVKYVRRTLSERGASDIIACIGLLDLYRFPGIPGALHSVSQRHTWARKKVQDDVGAERFHMYLAVHETEAWLLSQPCVFEAALQEAVTRLGHRPEEVNLDNPPAKRLNALYIEKMRRNYGKTADGKSLFARLDPEEVRRKCPYLRGMLDDLLKMAKDARPVNLTVRALPQPFLKWAGGKGQLLAELLERIAIAGEFGAYHEPFIGGGALFFGLMERGVLHDKAHLSDSNPHLIDCYLGVQQGVEEIIGLLSDHNGRHCKEYYYQARAAVPESVAARAARIIYLNRTCFNGLYRENSKGGFNVPMGSYTNPRICDAENLRACSAALKHAHIAARPFETVLDFAKPGDFVYFDPPYVPLSATSSFTAYSKGGFGEDSQRRLAEVFAKLARCGVKALLSNSKTPLVLELYKDFRIETVYATRLVNSRADRRGKVAEVLVRNF